MSETTYALEPRDLLFMRDARPMEASDAGLGANWPRPDQLWNAIINAFHRTWPARQEWEGAAHTIRDGENQLSSCRFGALKTIGPFPMKNGEVYYPCPLDLDMTVVSGLGTNLPKPLTHAFQSVRIGKREEQLWLSASEYRRYVRDEAVTAADPSLFDTERNIGIAIAAATHSTEKGKLYQAEYLRLRSNVRLVFAASCDILPKQGKSTVDVFAKLGCPADIILGGQQGVATLRTSSVDLQSAISNLKCSPSLLLRWTLLTPALFPAISENTAKGVCAHPGGWLPNWVAAETGRVMLPREGIERLPGEARDVWRQRVKDAPGFEARLIAARVGKPMGFSGWDLQTGPKTTQLAVPAGSVYLFQCASSAEAVALAQTLDAPNRRSTLFGEKGFGLGVCSPILKSQI